jgi:hypothetical protein
VTWIPKEAAKRMKYNIPPPTTITCVRSDVLEAMVMLGATNANIERLQCKACNFARKSLKSIVRIGCLYQLENQRYLSIRRAASTDLLADVSYRVDSDPRHAKLKQNCSNKSWIAPQLHWRGAPLQSRHARDRVD